MSCHDVGRALNNVVREIMRIYDAGEIDAKSAKCLVIRCADSVGWCDGNSSEAVDYIRSCVCGRCFKKIPKSTELFSIWKVSREVPDRYNIRDEEGHDLASDGLCGECFDIVMSHHCRDENAGNREMVYIREHYADDHFSTGEYADNNNGCMWID